jgi:hypothetical protein
LAQPELLNLVNLWGLKIPDLHRTQELGMANLTRQETRAFVEKMMASGKGDPGRLQHILTVLSQGRQLYQSDQKYIDEKFSQEIGLQESLKVEESILVKIQKLISSGAGDTGRLQFILEFLKQGKTLYKSDQQYLESKLGQKIDYTKIIMEKQDSDKTIESLKSQVSWANQKIANLESVITQKISHLQSEHRQHGTLPKGWEGQGQSLDQIQKQLATEQQRLGHEKTEAEKIRIEQSKLTQIILDRKEFEKQVKIEKEQLQKQIAQEHNKILEQNKLIEQIKSQEAELAQARSERDSIMLQLQKEQAEIAAQAQAERAHLAEQAQVAKKIQEERQQLELIRAENQKITLEAKSQERQLEEQVKQEKAKIATQAKLLKTISNYEKFLSESKQKQSEIAKQILDQKNKILSAAPSVSQIKSDQELLDKILQDRTALENQIKTATTELRSIKKEKAAIERQIKAQKTQLGRQKKKEAAKLKQLEQKKKIISKSISAESEKIKKLAKS